MKHIIQDENGKKMIMEVVSSMPQLPEGWSVLGLSDDLPEAVAEIAAAAQAQQTVADARQLLSSTDFKVLRHIREKALVVATTLTEPEYLALEQSRQDAVEIIRASEE